MPFLHAHQAGGSEASQDRPLPLPFSNECFTLAHVLLSKVREKDYTVEEVREMNRLAKQSCDTRGVLFTEILLCIMDCISNLLLALPDQDC